MLIIEGVNIHSIATCVPKNVIDNLEFGEKIFGKDIKKMIKATGIKERRVCKNENTSSLDLCVKAAEELLKNNEKLRDEIGAVVFVTTSPEYILPNNATLVHIEYPDILDINIPAGIITFQTSYKGGIGIRSEGFEIVDEFNTGPTSANAQIDIVYVFGDCQIARY